jgi:hypothetical protein
MKLLDGIHEEAADLLKDKSISPNAIRLLKGVSGVRQIEIAEVMVTANNHCASYAEALVLCTPKDQMVNPSQPKKNAGMSAEDIAKRKQEMESLERDMKAVTENYTENLFNLAWARTFIKKLMENTKVVRHLTSKHPEIYAEFETIMASETV